MGYMFETIFESIELAMVAGGFPLEDYPMVQEKVIELFCLDDTRKAGLRLEPSHAGGLEANFIALKIKPKTATYWVLYCSECASGGYRVALFGTGINGNYRLISETGKSAMNYKSATLGYIIK